MKRKVKGRCLCVTTGSLLHAQLCTALSVDCKSVIYDVAPILFPLPRIQFWQLISINMTHCEGLLFSVSFKDPLHSCISVQLAQFTAPQRHVTGLYKPKTVMVMLEGCIGWAAKLSSHPAVSSDS